MSFPLNSMVISHSHNMYTFTRWYIPSDPTQNHHCPMVFPWFSRGFPMVWLRKQSLPPLCLAQATHRRRGRARQQMLRDQLAESLDGTWWRLQTSSASKVDHSHKPQQNDHFIIISSLFHHHVIIISSSFGNQNAHSSFIFCWWWLFFGALVESKPTEGLNYRSQLGDVYEYAHWFSIIFHSYMLNILV